MYDYFHTDNDPAECEHLNGSLPEGAGFDCEDCGELFSGPRFEVSHSVYGQFWTYGNRD